jgi:hypothetical protein
METMGLGLTINQAALLFFPKKFAYDYARVRMKKMWEMNVLKRYTNNLTGELIYYLPDEKKPTLHNNAAMNIYANFKAAGYKITEFKTEKEWLEGKYKSDAYIVAETDEVKRIAIVEVDLSSLTNIKKYEELFETKQLQKEHGDFPMVVILSDVERSYKSDFFEVVTMDLRCSDFNSKVLVS